MGITASTSFESLNRNELLLRLVSSEPIELNNSFWTDLLSFSFSAPLKSEDTKALADATHPLCSRLVDNGVVSGNLYTLVQLFVWRCDLLCHAYQTGESLQGEMPLLTYNSLLLIRQLTQHLLRCCTEDQLENYFNPPAPSPPNSPVAVPRKTEAGCSTGEVDRTSPSLRGTEAAPACRSDVASSATSSYINQARLMVSAESGYAVLDDDMDVPLTKVFADSAVVRPTGTPKGASSTLRKVDPTKVAARPVPTSLSSDTLAGDRVDGSAESLLDSLCQAIALLPAEDDVMHDLIVECMQAFLVLLSTQQDGRKMGFALDHLVMNCNFAKNVVKSLVTYFVKQPPPPEKPVTNSLLGGLWSMVFTTPPEVKKAESLSPLAHLSLHLLLVLTNYFQQKGQKNPFHFSLCFIADDRDRDTNRPDVSFVFNLGSLYNTLCTQLTNPQTTLLFYLLLHGNPRVAGYILSRTDIDGIVLPLLSMLYAAESQSQQHIYMMLIVMLILTQDEQFNRAVHEVELKSVPWYKDRALGPITLGSVMILVIIRTMQYNMAKLRDKFLHNNCLAALANMSASIRNIHPFAAQRLFGLFEGLSKKHQRLLRAESRSKETKASDEQPWDISALEEILRTILEIVNAALTAMLVHNPHLIYALLHRQRILAPYSTLPQFSDIMSNIDMVLTFFASRLEDSSNASVDDVLAMIAKGVRQWPHDCLARFPDLRFRYVEEDHSEEFFIPYIWQLVHSSPLLNLKTSS